MKLTCHQLSMQAPIRHQASEAHALSRKYEMLNSEVQLDRIFAQINERIDMGQYETIFDYRITPGIAETLRSYGYTVEDTKHCIGTSTLPIFTTTITW